MADGALRSVFAELGIDFDERSLQKANALVDKAIGNVQKLVGATGKADQVEALFAARQKARAAVRHQQSVRAADDAAKAAVPSREAGLFGKLREVAAGDAKAREEARAAELDRAHTLAARRALGHAGPAFDPFGKGKAQGATGFGGQFGTDRWKAASKPVEGMIGLLTKLERKTSTAIGQKLPQAFQRLAEKAGVARGDFASMGQVLTGLTGTVTAALGLGVATAANFTSEFTAASEALRETARNARVTSAELQALQHAGTISGVGAERVTASVTALGSKLRDANSHLAGSSGVVHALARMGISARDASGQVRPTVDILDDVAVAMEHISSPRRRVRVAESLGLDRRMLDVLHTGAGGIRALREEMAELGGGVTPEATEAARKFAQAQARMQVGLTSVRSVIFTSLAPTMEGLVTKGAKLLGWLARVTRGSHMARNVLAALGIAGAAAAAPLIAAWLPAAAPFLLAAAGGLALALALDDVQNFLEGNNSLTGDFVTKLRQMADGFIGVGNSARVVRFLNDDWNELGNNVARLLDFIERLPGAMQPALAPLRLLLRGFTALTGREAGVSGGAEGASTPPPAPAPSPARGALAPAQPGIPAANVAAWQAGQPVVIPATRAVPAPGAAGSTTVTTHVEGDRNTFHIDGNDTAAMRRELEQLMDDRDRRRRERLSPRGDGG